MTATDLENRENDAPTGVSPAHQALEDQRSAAAGRTPGAQSEIDRLNAQLHGKAAEGEGANRGVAGGAANAINSGVRRAASLYSPEAAIATGAAQRFIGFFTGSPERKRNNIIGTGGLIAAAIATALFVSFLPNEVITLMSQLEQHFFAGVTADIEAGSDRLMSDYIKHRILQRMGLQCKSSVNLAKCIADGKAKFGKVTCEADDAVCNLFNSWDESDLAGQLSANGVEFEVRDNGRIFMVSPDLPQGEVDITDFSKSDADNLFEDNRLLEDGFVDDLHSIKDRLVVAVGSFLHSKGFTGLFHGASWDGDGDGNREDAEQETQADRESAEEAQVAGQVEPDFAAAENEGISCLADANCDPTHRTAGTDNAGADPTSGTPESDFEKNTDGALDQVASALPNKKLTDLVKAYNDLKTKGTDALADLVARTLSGIPTLDVSSAAVKQIASKFTVIQWVQMAAQAISFLHGAVIKLRAINFTIHAAALIPFAITFASEADKQKSQCVDSTSSCQNNITMIGSYANALNALGSTAVSSPAVDSIINPATAQTDASVHASLQNDHMTLNDYNNFITQASQGLNAIPGFNFLALLASLVNNVINGALGPINWGVGTLTNLTGINQLIGLAVGPLMLTVANHLWPMPPLHNLSGSEAGEGLVVGTHLLGSKAGEGLGGKRVSHKVAEAVADAQQSKEMRAFQHQPLFARLFSTKSPYSFVTQLSLRIPTNFSTMLQTSLAGLLQNPLDKLFGGVATVFHPHYAFAAATADVSPDGVPDNFIPLNDPVFTQDSEKYQKQQQCAQQQQQDFPNWNKQVKTDPDTGQVYHTTTNGCALWLRICQGQQVFDANLQCASVSTASSTSSSTPVPGGCGGGKYGALVSSGSSFAGVDQGIDFVPSGSGGYNICAPANGTITLADQTGHHFLRTTGQAEIIETLDQAPGVPHSTGANGKTYIYYAEIIKIDSNLLSSFNAAKAAGQKGVAIQKGDLIGTNDQSPGIEVGWGTDETHGFLCGIAFPSACGTSFNDWVQKQ